VNQNLTSAIEDLKARLLAADPEDAALVIRLRSETGELRALAAPGSMPAAVLDLGEAALAALAYSFALSSRL
jgi:hypothetical protein